MKRIHLLWAVLVVTVLATSCSTMRKDCQGNKHVKLKNGIYI